MQLSYAVAAAVMASVASAMSNVTYTTVVVDTFTTVCPEATSLTFNGITYTVTQSQTLTITNCPCTISKPVYTAPVVYCSTCSPPPVYVNTTAPVVVIPTTPAIIVPPPTTPVLPVGTSAPTTSAPKASFTGAANKAAVGSAALAGLAGFAALLL